ncbi:hypothetical protein D3C75_603680 [compost metagenome]
MTQRQNFFHHWRVVPLACIRALIGCASRIGAVHFFAQFAVVAVSKHWQIAWDIQRQQPAILLFGFGLSACCRQCTFRHTRKLRFVSNQFRPALGRIQHVVAVGRTQFRQARSDFAIALLFFWRQTDARKLEITQCVINSFFLSYAQIGIKRAIAQVAIRLIKPFVLPNPGAVLRQQRQRLFVSLTQFRAVLHGIQMTDRREDAAQAIVHFCQRLAKIIPVIRRALRYHAFDFRTAIIQRLLHGWHDMFRFESGKRRQIERGQQWISHKRGS